MTPDDPNAIGTFLGMTTHEVEKTFVVEIVKLIVAPALTKASKAAKDFFAKRIGRATATVADGTKMLQDVGLKPQPVPGRILFPILEYSAREEEETLHRRWAALLANAGSPSEVHNKVLPAYAEILRQLTPPHVAILDLMYGKKHVEPSLPGWHPTWPEVPREEIEQAFSLSHADFAVLVSDLDRLAIVEGHRKMALPDGFSIEDKLTIVETHWNSRVKYERVQLTTLGIRFMMAVTPPEKATA